MAKRDILKRIDYDNFFGVAPVALQTTVVDQATQPNSPVSVYAFTDLTPGGSEDTAVIDAALTVDDIIRATVGPITDTGASFDLVVPLVVEPGDLMLLIATQRTEHDTAFVISNGFTMGLTSPSGWDAYYSSESTVLADASIPTDKIGLDLLARVAGVGDAGSTVTFNYISGGTPESYHYYLIVFNNSYISVQYDVNTGINDIDGYGDGQTQFYSTGVNIANNNSFLLFMACLDGNVRVAPGTGYTEFADTGDTNVSLYVMGKITAAGNTGFIYATPDDAGVYFGSMALEVRPSV